MMRLWQFVVAFILVAVWVLVASVAAMLTGESLDRALPWVLAGILAWDKTERAK